MSGIKIANGTAASAEQTVDTNGNAHVVLPTTESQAGFATLSGEIDAGTITGSRYQRALEVSDDYRLRVGIDTIVFNQSFEGTNIARDRIQQNDSTMTAAQASGFLTVNSAAATASGNNCNVRTYRTFPLFGTFPTYLEVWVQEANETATNTVSEWGFGYATGSTAPTDGVFFRRVSGGQLRGIVSYGGSETAVDLTSPTAGNTHHYLIVFHNEEVEFWINDVLYGKVATPSAQPSPSSSMALPFFARVYNSAVASAGRQVKLGFLSVVIGDSNYSAPPGHTLNGFGGGAYQIQPGTASGPTVTRGAAQTGWPTSATAQTAPTYTATSAPATNSLGGYFVTPAVSTLADSADYPIYSYLNPAGTSTLPGRTLYITSVRIGELIARTAASTNTSIMVFAIGIGSTSSATTATEGAAVVAARLIPVGQVFWSATSAIGDTKGGWTMDFGDAPLVCPPNTYVQLIMRHIGTVTSNTLTVQGTAAFIGYHE